MWGSGRRLPCAFLHPPLAAPVWSLAPSPRQAEQGDLAASWPSPGLGTWLPPGDQLPPGGQEGPLAAAPPPAAAPRVSSGQLTLRAEGLCRGLSQVSSGLCLLPWDREPGALHSFQF